MELAIISMRTVLTYLFILVIIRLMGKREVGKLSPFDLVVAIMIAELAALSLEGVEVPFSHGLLPIAILASMEILLAWVSLRSKGFRKLVNGKPQIIIGEGKILVEEMSRARYTVDDLLTQLRAGGFHDIADVQYAILETSGKLSIIPKASQRPVSPADLAISVEQEILPALLISDGEIDQKELTKQGRDQNWLLEQLAKEGLVNPSQVLIASLGRSGELYLVPKKK